MSATIEKRRWTDAELMALPRDGRKREFLAGELLVSPTGFRHGYIGIRLAGVLMDFALKRGLGVAVDSSTGFRMKSGDCLSPDVSFVRKERLTGLVYYSADSYDTLRDGDYLSGESRLPSFTFPVSELFDMPSFNR